MTTHQSSCSWYSSCCSATVHSCTECIYRPPYIHSSSQTPETRYVMKLAYRLNVIRYNTASIGENDLSLSHSATWRLQSRVLWKKVSTIWTPKIQQIYSINHRIPTKSNRNFSCWREPFINVKSVSVRWLLPSSYMSKSVQ